MVNFLGGCGRDGGRDDDRDGGRDDGRGLFNYAHRAVCQGIFGRAESPYCRRKEADDGDTDQRQAPNDYISMTGHWEKDFAIERDHAPCIVQAVPVIGFRETCWKFCIKELQGT